jgi:hypothetical protein
VPVPVPVPPPAPARGAAPVLPPAAYTVPAGATTVSTSAQLVSALAQPGARDIVLADGTYDNARAFGNPDGDRLYAAHLGKAVLTAGIWIGGNWGPGGAVLQGLAFDVSDAAKADDSAAVDIWGTGKNTKILDTTIDGHSTLAYGIRNRVPEGLVVQRVVAHGFTSNGIDVDSYPDKLTFTNAPSLQDVDVAGVSRAVPGSSDGTSEACIWLGTQVTLTRAKVRSCAWMGLWTGFNGVGSTYSDVDADATPVGIYLEHFTTGSTFRNIHVGTGVRTGINCEWADPAWGGKPASTDNVIEDSLIESYSKGVYMDEGTTRTTVRDTTFRGQAAAAIVDYKGVGNSYSGNDYSGIARGAVAVSTNHL